MRVENWTEKNKKHLHEYKILFFTETFVDSLKLYLEKQDKTADQAYNFQIYIEVLSGEKVILS